MGTRMSCSLDSISQTINSTFDFEDFPKITLAKNVQLNKILLEAKYGLGLGYYSTIYTLYFGHHILSSGSYGKNLFVRSEEFYYWLA